MIEITNNAQNNSYLSLVRELDSERKKRENLEINFSHYTKSFAFLLDQPDFKPLHDRLIKHLNS